MPNFHPPVAPKSSTKSLHSLLFRCMIPLFLLLVLSPLLPILHASPGPTGVTLRISRNPDIVKTYLVGSYLHNDSGVEQVTVPSPDAAGGAAAVSWSLGIDFENVTVIRLSFQMMTRVTQGGPYGPRVGAVVAFSTSPADCCPSDRSALFAKNSKVVAVDTDCCFAGANLFFDSRLWVNPDAPNSGDRITPIFQKQVSGYANDGTFHSYTIEMNLASQTTTWIADGGAATAAYTGFTFTPSYLAFSAEGHDAGDNAAAQVRSIQLALFTKESGSSPSSQASAPPASPYSQWWFWTIVGLTGLSAILVFSNLRPRHTSSKTTSAVPSIIAARDQLETCSQCGSQMPLGSQFCGRCGQKINGGA